MLLLPDKIIDILTPLYGDDSLRIKLELEEYLQGFHVLTKREYNPYWYKLMHLYAVYPDGINYNKHFSPLKNLELHLPFIKELGFNAIHILPFLKSPMVDRGFDVSDYFSIREELGTMHDLLELKEAANGMGLNLFMDFVLNHLSEQHEWFQKAQQGDEIYRDYFIVSRTKPHFIKKFHKNATVWARYRVDEKIRDVSIAFPEYTGDIPHWRQGTDGYWYYHTYYPQQLDLNWFNPNLFIEMFKILIFWCHFGFNFRLDAIPFVGKSAYKFIDYKNEFAHSIIAASQIIIKAINPECVLLVETFEKLHTVIGYFGNPKTQQANIAYNFHLTTNIWVSLAKRNVDYIWQKIEIEKNIPAHAEWLNFLRNHDELSLAHLKPRDARDTKKVFAQYGKDFREGHGISGRTFSLLGSRVKKFLMSYFLLASIPGGLMMTYGDEIATKNIPLSKLNPFERTDTRNINRGKLKGKIYFSERSKKYFEHIASILNNRNKLKDYFCKWPQRINISKDIYAAIHNAKDNTSLIIYINFSHKTKKIQLNSSGVPLYFINHIAFQNNYLKLGPYAGVWLIKK